MNGLKINNQSRIHAVNVSSMYIIENNVYSVEEFSVHLLSRDL